MAARKKATPKKTSKKRKPLWTPEEGVTQSAIGKFLQCPEQFSLEYIEGVTTTRFQIPLEFGSIWHLCLEHQFDGDATKTCERITREYREKKVPNLKVPADREALDIALTQIRTIFPIYCDYWSKKDREITWVKREEKFRFPHTLPSGKTIDLRGMRDGVFRNKNGTLGLFETKTKSNIDETAIADTIRSDMQTLLYCYSLQRDYGEDPSNIIYNVVRRPGLKFRKDDTLPLYAERLAAEVNKKPDYYFIRWNIDVLPSDISRFVETTLNPVLERFLHWWGSVSLDPFNRFQSPYHFLNCNELYGKYGRASTYEYIVRGRKGSYMQRSCPFPELAE
jgi:hypothetical protein